MRILFISSDNNATSGAFLSMIKLNKLLQERHRIYTKIILPKAGDGESMLRENNIDFAYVKSFSWIVHDKRRTCRDWAEYFSKLMLQIPNAFAILKIRKLIQDEKFDIVHINTSFSYVGAIAQRKTDARLVWHIREFLEEDRNLKILNRRYGYRLMNRADRIVAISDSIYQKYESIFTDNRLCAIYNGIDVQHFYQKRSIFENDSVNFLIVGSVSPEKGQKDVVEALAKLKGIDVHLHIVGKIADNAYKNQLDRIIDDHDLKEKIAFYGKRNDVIEFQKKADIAFVCSRAEAFGRVTVEAMLAGCLVIGADSAGTKEILQNGKYGLLYSYGDAESLKKQIIYAIHNRDAMRQLAKSGQTYALENYSAERNADRIASEYRKLSS